MNLHFDNKPHHPPRLLHNSYVLKTEYPNKECHQLLMEQQHIGWDDFFHGKILKQWRIYQHNYE